MMPTTHLSLRMHAAGLCVWIARWLRWDAGWLGRDATTSVVRRAIGAEQLLIMLVRRFRMALSCVHSSSQDRQRDARAGNRASKQCTMLMRLLCLVAGGAAMESAPESDRLFVYS